MNFISNRLGKIFLTYDVISLILALLIWQGNFEGRYFTFFIGLFLPSLLLVIRRIKSEYSNIHIVSIVLMVYGFLNWPNGLQPFWDQFLIMVLAGGAAFLLNPPKEFATGILLCFWSFFLFFFIAQSPFEHIKEVFSGKLLSEIQHFAVSPEGVSFITSNIWWLCLIGGFVCSLIHIFLFKQRKTDRYMMIMGLLSFPFLLVPFVVTGVIWGLYKLVNIYVNEFADFVKAAKPGEESNSQPAVKKYLFHKAYVDVKKTFQESLKKIKEESGCSFRKIITNHVIYGWVVNLYSALLRMISGTTVLLIGTIWLTLVSIIHLILLVVFGMPVYLFFFLIWGIDRGYRSMNNIQTVCPTCHHQSNLPIYICPSCHQGHSQLVPGVYGILKRRCQCGEKIPTTFFNGRVFLEAKCSSCHTTLHSKESTPIVIPIIGGPNTGKTCFMISVTQELIDQVASKQNWNISFIDDNARKTFEDVSMNMKNGRLPAKTINDNLTAFNFFISNQKWKTEKMVYFYDPAGEAFSEISNLKDHHFYEYRHGSVFMIDPFSIPEIGKQYEKDSTYHSIVNPSSEYLEEIFDRLMINFQEKYGIKSHEKIDTPIAFIINKVDAYDIDQRIGETAAKAFMEKNPNMINIEEVIHKLCYDFLSSAGMNNFLRKIDDKFTNYRFFACSSLKSTSSTSVIKPILWLFSQADKDLKVLGKRE